MFVVVKFLVYGMVEVMLLTLRTDIRVVVSHSIVIIIICLFYNYMDKDKDYVGLDWIRR